MPPSGYTRRSWSDEHMRAVADVYEEAIEARFPTNVLGVVTTTLAVAETWGVVPQTAQRWISESRKRGFLRA